MSHHVQFKSQFTDREALIRALCRVEHPVRGSHWTRNSIELHDQAQILNDWRGDCTANKGNVIVRRQNIDRLSTDLGFELTKEGTYNVHIDEAQKNWVTRLTTYYNVEKTKMELDQRGIKYVESLDEKGRIQLKAKFENKFTQSNFNTKLSTKF